MADEKPNAAVRPSQGVRRTTTHSGVIHVRTYQSGQYVVVGNHLAQHRELSLTAIGLATHILSVPEGTPVDIRSLAERFPEGRERIASALRELEAYGYLERVREHAESGRLVTRTYAHHTPAPARAAVPPVPLRVAGRPAVARARTQRPVTGADVPEAPQEDDQVVHQPPTVPDKPEDTPEAPEPPMSPMLPKAHAPRDPRHERAVTLLAGLRHTDDRLTLSLRDVNTLAPSVIRWFEVGATTAAVHRTLTAGLPVDIKSPAALLAHRLGELLPPPLPATPAPAPVTATDTGRTGGTHRPHPFQDCDGCGRVFRAPEPGRCRDCRTAPTTAAEPARAA
ncbi:helix-turn-helix domain-containing protein [Streptomyces sp. JNUCC 63]